jgi:hypothetical protein
MDERQVEADSTLKMLKPLGTFLGALAARLLFVPLTFVEHTRPNLDHRCKPAR